MNTRHLTTLLVVLVSLATASFTRAEDKKLPEGKNVLTPGLESSNLNAGPKHEGEIKIIDVEGQPFKKAIHAVVKTVPAEPWHTQVNTMLAQSVKKDEVVLISFWVRAIGKEGKFTTYFGTPETDLEVTSSEEITANDKWKHVQIPATVAANYEAGKGMFNLDFGTQEQTLEFADIQVVRFGAGVKVDDLPHHTD